MKLETTQEPSKPVIGGIEDGLDFIEILMFMRRTFKLMVVMAVIAAAGTAGVLYNYYPKLYEGVSTLMLGCPYSWTDSKLGIVNVPDYARLLESKAIIEKTKQRLIKENIIDPNESLSINRELTTRIISKTGVAGAEVVILEAVAQAHTPEKADKISETWVEEFLVEIGQITKISVNTLVDKEMKGQFDDAKNKLKILQDNRSALTIVFAENYRKSADTWDLKMNQFAKESIELASNYRKGTVDAISEHQLETAKKLDAFKLPKKMTLRTVQLEAERKAYKEIQEEDAQVSAKLQLKRTQLDEIRKQSAQTAPLVLLHKAPSDDQLAADAVAVKEGGSENRIKKYFSLVTEEINPRSVALSAKLTDLEQDVNSLAPRRAQLEQELKSLHDAIIAQELKLSEDTLDLLKLSLERDRDLAKLREDREMGLSKLSKDRETHWTMMLRQQDEDLEKVREDDNTKLAQFDLDLDMKKKFMTEFIKRYNEASMAQTQLNMEQIAYQMPTAKAKLSQPAPRGIPSKVILAAFLGAVVAVLFRLTYELYKKAEKLENKA